MKRRVRDLVASLFVVAGMGLAILVYVWFSGRLSSGGVRRYAVRFNDVAGLRIGDPVEVRGVAGGRVGSIRLEKDSVLVEVALRKELLLAEDSRFAIRSVSYLGSDRFIMATPGTGTPAGPGFVFEGVNEALNLEGTLAGLDRVLSQLDITAMTEEMRSTVAELMTALRRAMPSLDSGLAGTVRELDRIADGVDSLHAMLATPSTARKLLTSDELYTELRRTNTELQALLADIREHPERYFSLRLR